jgi:acetyl esterase/lipase
MLWVHSGGHIFDNWNGNGPLLDQIALQMEAVVAVPAYSLSPENPYPAAHADCLEAWTWLSDHASDLGIDLNRIAVAGISAGGGIAVGLALRIRDEPARFLTAPRCLYLLYPMLDDRLRTPSSRWKDAAIWPREANAFGWRSYLRNVSDNVPSYAAPARAGMLDRLPPTFVGVGSSDLFLDESIAFARRLADAGVSADLRVYAGAPHGFVSLGPTSLLAGTAVDDALAWLAHRLDADNDPPSTTS